MKKNLLRISITVLMAVFVLLNTCKPASAQGTYDCVDPNNTGLCTAGNITCEDGYVPDYNWCANLSGHPSCNEQKGRQCMRDPQAKDTQPEAPLPVPGQGTTIDTPNLNAIEDAGLPGFNFAGSKGSTISTIFTSLFPWIFGIAGVLLLLYLIYGGFHLMISGGEPKAVAEAKGKITNALIGFVIIFVAFWIVQIVARVFGLQPIIQIFG